MKKRLIELRNFLDQNPMATVPVDFISAGAFTSHEFDMCFPLGETIQSKCDFQKRLKEKEYEAIFIRSLFIDFLILYTKELFVNKKHLYL